ncbi:ImmA/IrrE family metallo-endopeptidase [Lichenibacterium ramalinae]|uniref:ImmA/IrrE family metallo-endopeptidase n=1 Tax=Lichenibacterium ramalinae TaxID=2316527 RepID=A0A4Q2R9L1_9HYPH|nr:ImmA/IrrE family metallo-endopeptidase [Lichenibacterium ramalinae]RYB03625.1 ImmA/IrrE family metallo-endopeptidase [Lichenibacterium ramalinae]
MLLREQDRIIEEHQKRPPIKVVSLAHDLGLKVYRTELPEKVSGMIKKDDEEGGDSGYAIYVNEMHSETRRRFTIAHEIAHFILHKKIIGDGVVEDALLRSDALSNAVEIQANSLAADILMPNDLIKKAKKDGYKTITELAEYFNVSRDAMAIRLYKMNYESAVRNGYR